MNRYGTQVLNDETWWVPAGSGSVIEATFPDEGIYVGVDHAMNNVLKGGAFAVLATPDSTPDDHPAGTMVPPKGSDMVSGPPMEQTQPQGMQQLAPQLMQQKQEQNLAHRTKRCLWLMQQGQALMQQILRQQAHCNTGGAGRTNATTGAEASLTQLANETTNATTGAESLATTGAG